MVASHHFSGLSGSYVAPGPTQVGTSSAQLAFRPLHQSSRTDCGTGRRSFNGKEDRQVRKSEAARGRAGRVIAGVLMAAVVSGAGLTASATATASGEVSGAPVGVLLGTESPSAIPGQYIVRLKEHPRARGDLIGLAAELASKYGAEIGFVYERVFRGFSAALGEAEARSLAADPAVAQVEQQEIWTVDGQTSTDPVTQYGPSWGADRIDQRRRTPSLTYTRPNSASNVSVYVIDDGVRIDHVGFQGRARYGKDVVDGDFVAYQPGCSNHGTAMAGIVAGRDVGATDAQIVAVRVADCKGQSTDAQVAAGVEYVLAEQARSGAGPAVISYSLACSGPCSGNTVAAAMNSAIGQGLMVVGSTGNHNGDSCLYGKQGWAPAAITVGAADENDARWVESTKVGSNWGACVDLFAPGHQILTFAGSSQSGLVSASGSSPAVPFVAGVAALALGRDAGLSPSQINAELLNSATLNKLSNVGTGSPNRLLFNGAPTVPGGSSLAVARQSDGRLRLLAVDKSGAIVNRSQTSPGARDWDAWAATQPAKWSVLAAETQSNGRLLAAAVKPPSEAEHSWTLTQTATDPAKWGSLLQGMEGLAATALARNVDGRLDQFMVDSAGRSWYRWQTVPSGGWSPIKPWGDQPLGDMPVGTILRSIAAETNADGKISVIATSTRGEVWHKMQDQAAISWGGWTRIDGHMKSVAVAPNQNGRLELFGVDETGKVMHRTQTAAGTNNWAPWAQVPYTGSEGQAVSIAAETNADGLISLFWTNTAGELREIKQAMRNSTGWLGWSQLDGVVKP